VKRGRLCGPSTKQNLYIFVEEGVYRLGADYAEARTLVGSNYGFTNDFTQHHVRFSVLCAMSPAAERWKHLTKTVSVQFVVMNP
jgi:hypothetical protein